MKITIWHFLEVWEENILIELRIVYVGYIKKVFVVHAFRLAMHQISIFNCYVKTSLSAI